MPCTVHSSSGRIGKGSVTPRLRLGAPVSRERIYFLILRRELMQTNIDLDQFINKMLQEFESESPMSWYLYCTCEALPFLNAICLLLDLSHSLTKAKSFIGPMSLGSEKNFGVQLIWCQERFAQKVARPKRIHTH